MKKEMLRNGLFITLTLILLAIFLTSIYSTNDKNNKEVTLISHDSFVISPDLINEFEKTSGFKLRLLKAGDAGALTNKLILTKNSPIADVVFGIDNTLESKALKAKLIDGDLRATDYGDVCFNYDKYWFAEKKIVPPKSVNDLILPAYRKLVVIENPNTSSTGLSFLAATTDKYGSSWQKYWLALKENDVKVDDGWDKAYNIDFSGSAGKGKFPIVLSYATSPAAEVRNGESQIANILDGCFRQTEFVGLLNRAKNKKGAKALIDFLLDKRFQSSFPETMYMYPINDQANIPNDWKKFNSEPSRTYGDNLDFANQSETWLKEWNKIFA